MRILAVFFELNGYKAHVWWEDTDAPNCPFYGQPLRGTGWASEHITFTHGKWDGYGDAHRWEIVGGDTVDIVQLVQRCMPADILVMNRPARGEPEVEAWEGAKARAEHWTWAAGIWNGVARALGCTRVRTVEGAQSVEDLIAFGRKALGR